MKEFVVVKGSLEQSTGRGKAYDELKPQMGLHCVEFCQSLPAFVTQIER